MYRSNISAIVYRKNDGKYLIVHKPRERHAWQFPQGGVDPGETLEQAALRELEEELGTSAFDNLQMSQHLYFYEFEDGKLREGKYSGQKQAYCMVEFTGTDEDIQLEKAELDEFRWVYQAELSEYFESSAYLEKVHQVILELKDGAF